MSRISRYFALTLATCIVASAAVAHAESIWLSAESAGGVSLPLAESLVTDSSDAADSDAAAAVDQLASDELTFSNVTAHTESDPPRSVNFSPVGIMIAANATATVPEPGTLVLAGLGMIGVLFASRRRR